MNKFFLMMIFAFQVACSSSILIRKSDYYNPELNTLLSISSPKESLDIYAHHPSFEGTSLFKEGPPSYETTKNHYFFGLFPLRSEVKMSEACQQNKFRQAYIHHSWKQLLLVGITYGIYTPTTIQIWCENEKI